MTIKHLIEEPIKNIWEKFSPLTKNIPPLSVSSVPDDSIIFIGINPSLSDSDRKILEKQETKKNDVGFYELPSEDKGDDNDEKQHRYFKKFYEINKRLKIPIGHIDLLYIRETQQNNVKALLKKENGIAFIFEQLQVTRKVMDEIIAKSNPKAFVVNNTLARDFLGRFKNEGRYGDDKHYPKVENKIHWMNYCFDWDNDLGTYVLETKEGRRIPFFFTSMLTGQRALDNGSFDRLIWHLDYVIKNEKPSTP